MNKRDHVVNAALLSAGTAVLLGVVPSPTTGETPVLAAATLPALGVAVATEAVRYGVPVTLGALFPDVDTAFGRHRKTFHNLLVLATFLAFPLWFDNLRYVWLGVLTHLVLDFLGSARGVALFYPLSTDEYSFPGGVSTTSPWATPVTVAVTGLELAALAAVHFYVVPLDAGATAAARALGTLVGI
jgi:membrane-bound metal-dependent hydrolase YbcI (DUF457 family)